MTPRQPYKSNILVRCAGPIVLLVDAETETPKSLRITSYDLEELRQAAKTRFQESLEVDSLTHKIGDITYTLQDDEDVKQLKDGTKVSVTWAVNLFGL